MSMIGWIILGVIVLVLLYLMAIYNRLVRLLVLVKEGSSGGSSGGGGGWQSAYSGAAVESEPFVFVNRVGLAHEAEPLGESDRRHVIQGK